MRNLRQEIDERRKTEEKLRRSEAYLAEAQAMSHTGSWAFNPSLEKMAHWSDETFRIFELDPKPAPPNLGTFEQQIHPQDRGRVHQFRVRTFREKADYEDDYRVLLPDGRMKHVHAIGHPVLDEAGEVVEYVGTVADVTDRKRAQEERDRLHQLEADLARIDRIATMGELTASLAHELKQQLQPPSSTPRLASLGSLETIPIRGRRVKLPRGLLPTQRARPKSSRGSAQCS